MSTQQQIKLLKKVKMFIKMKRTRRNINKFIKKHFNGNYKNVYVNITYKDDQ